MAERQIAEAAGGPDAAGAGEGRRALRDRAQLLTGFAGGFQRSELDRFTLRDATFSAELLAHVA